MPRPSFTARCESMLTAAGFQIADTGVEVADAGVTVDFVVNNRDEIAFYVLCGGTDRGRTPGCRSVETLKAAIAESYALHVHGFGPVLLLTARLPNTDAGRALLAGVSPHVLFDALDIQTAGTRLGWLAQADDEQLMRDSLDRLLAWLKHTKQPRLKTYGPYPPRSRQRAAAFQSPDPAASASLADQFSKMWRDSRKYALPPTPPLPPTEADRALLERAMQTFENGLKSRGNGSYERYLRIREIEAAKAGA